VEEKTYASSQTKAQKNAQPCQINEHGRTMVQLIDNGFIRLFALYE